MALPSNPQNGEYVRPSDDVIYKYNSSDNSFRTFDSENEYASIAEYSYRYKNINGNISAPYIGEDDTLTIEIPYNFKQETYTPSNVGGQFTITLPDSPATIGGIPVTNGSFLVREVGEGILGLYNKGQNNSDYPFGTAITISGNQLVISDTLTVDDVSPTIEVSYLPTARERDGISIFASFDIKNFDELEGDIEIIRIYNSIDPNHYASFYLDKNTNFYEIFYSNYDSSTGTYTTGNAVGSTVRNLTDEVVEIRIEDFFNDTFSVWNTKLDLYADREDDVDVTDNAFPDNLFYDTIEILGTGKYLIKDVLISYGDNSRIDILSDDVNFEDVQPDVYYEIKEYGDYILESDSLVNYTISNNGAASISWWAIGAEASQGYQFFGAAGTQNASLIAGGGATDIQRTEIFNGSYWVEAGDLNSNQMESNKLVGGVNSALTVGNLYGAIIPDEIYNGSSWSIGQTSNGDEEEVVEAGIPTAALKAGGFNSGTITEKYNSSSWFTNAAWNLNGSRIAPSGTGEQNAALAITGSGVASTEKFNGTSWSVDVNVNTVRLSSSADGDQNEAILIGGSSGGALATVEYYNGNSWFLITSMNTAKNALASCGNSSSLMATIGTSTELFQNENSFRVIKNNNIDVIDDSIEMQDTSTTFQIIRNNSFSGGVWSVTASLNNARYNLAGAGTQNAALAIGGYFGVSRLSSTEKFDGNSWSTNAAWDLNTARSTLAGVGTQNAALSFGGSTPGAQPFTEKFDGNSWSTNAAWDLNTARSSPGGVGTQNAALAFGGFLGTYLVSTEKFNGSSWSTQSGWDLNTAIQSLSGAGTQNAALGFGGATPSAQPFTEKFDGSSWSITSELSIASFSLAGAGEQDAALKFGGTGTGGSSYLTSTEKFNGFYWIETNSLNTARRGLAGSGAQNAALCFAGNNPGELDVTEKFNYTPEVTAVLTY